MLEGWPPGTVTELRDAWSHQRLWLDGRRVRRKEPPPLRPPLPWSEWEPPPPLEVGAIELPPELDETDAEVWEAWVPEGTALALWQDGPTVRTCELGHADVIAADAEHVRLALRGYQAYFPWVRRDALYPTLVVEGAFLETPDGERFGWVDGGARLERDGELWSLVGQPSVRGVVDPARIGPIYRFGPSGQLRPPDVGGEHAGFVDHLELLAPDGTPRAVVRDASVSLVAVDGDLADVVVFAGGALVRGWIPEDALPDPPPDDGSWGLEGTGTSGKVPSRQVYVARGAWLYGAPDPVAELARVRAEGEGFTAREAEVPEGWLAVVVESPWGVLDGFVRAADVVPEGRGRDGTYVLDLLPGACAIE